MFGYSGHSTDGTAFNLQELLKNNGSEEAKGCLIGTEQTVEVVEELFIGIFRSTR